MESRQIVEMKPGERYWATRPYGYNGAELDRGQVFTCQGMRGDRKLGAMGYVGTVPKRATLCQCGTCGAEFIDEPCRRAHGNKHHPRRPLNAVQEDERAEREDRMLAEVAPVGVS